MLKYYIDGKEISLEAAYAFFYAVHGNAEKRGYVDINDFSNIWESRLTEEGREYISMLTNTMTNISFEIVDES
jgi:hypothetical protein